MSVSVTPPTPAKKAVGAPFYYGGVSAAAASMFTHPIDQQKYRLQVQTTKASMLQTLLRSARSAGVVSLWDGASASVLRQLTYSTTRFAMYEVIQKGWREYVGPNSGPLSMAALSICAGLSGGLGGMVGNPMEIVLVRMSADGVKPLGDRYRYRNVFDGLYRITTDEGIKTLYRGLGPNIMRSVVMNISQLAAYDAIKGKLLAAPSLHLHDDVRTHLLSGVLAGTIATTAAAPFDVLKSRIQSSAGHSSIMDIVKKGFQAEGPLFLMKGWTPAWMRLTPNTILMFVIFEQMKAIHQRWQQ